MYFEGAHETSSHWIQDRRSRQESKIIISSGLSMAVLSAFLFLHHLNVGVPPRLCLQFYLIPYSVLVRQNVALCTLMALSVIIRQIIASPCAAVWCFQLCAGCVYLDFVLVTQMLSSDFWTHDSFFMPHASVYVSCHRASKNQLRLRPSLTPPSLYNV